MKKIHADWLISCGNFFFRYRNAVFPLAFVVFFLAFPPAEYSLPVSICLTVLGAILVSAGQLFRLLVIGFAYIKRGGKEGKVYADRLVIRGFYAHSRNPMYLGNILVVIGVTVIHGSVAAFMILFPFFCFAYLAIIAAEETYLRAHFAEHAAYCEKVNRIWPNFKGLAESLRDFHYDWRRALRKDYGNIFLNFSLMIFVILWRLKIENVSVSLVSAAACFVPLVLFYVASRLLKKTGLLYSPD